MTDIERELRERLARTERGLKGYVTAHQHALMRAEAAEMLLAETMRLLRRCISGPVDAQLVAQLQAHVTLTTTPFRGQA